MGGRSIPRGQLYLTAPVMFGKLHVLPVVSALLAQNDGLSARMMLIDRNVRIIEEASTSLFGLERWRTAPFVC